MKNILFVNQALNRNTINMYEKIACEYGHGYVITGTDIEVNSHCLTVVKAFPHNAHNYLTRIVSWIGFAVSVNRWLTYNIKYIDKVLVYSNPPIAPLYMGYICGRRQIGLNIMIWDIYPQVIEKMTIALLIKPITMLWRKLNIKIFKYAASVMTLGEVMKHAIDPDSQFNISVIPNWSSPERIKPVKKNTNLFLEKQGIKDRFIVLYSGKMGIGHEIKTVINAAHQCKDPDILFLFIGWGPGVNIVSEFIRKGSENVILMPLQDEKIFPYSIASGDVGIVSQVNGLERFFMPSKTYDMMAAGLPILGISTGDNDLKRTIDRHECGYNVKSNDSAELLRRIMELKTNNRKRDDMGRNSRLAVENYYNEDVLFNEYRRILKLDEND